MSSARSFRRAAGAAIPFALAVGCADPAAAPVAPAGAALAPAQPVAHWMRAQTLPAAYDIAAAGAALYAASSDAGIFRSADGMRWERLAQLEPGADPATIAAAPSGALYVGTASGVRRSDDGGYSWTPAGLDGDYVSHVAVDPRGSVYAAVSGIFGGVYRSDDAGATWLRVREPSGGRESFFTFLRVRKGDVLVGLYAQVPLLGYDAGAAWAPLLSLFEIPDFVGSVDDLLETQNGALVAAWANGLARSEDGGTSWKVVFEGTPAFKLLEAPSGALYALVGAGSVLRSTDDGATWAPFASAPPMTGIDALVAAPDGRLVVAGYYGAWKATR